ncbi:MAG: hypothetical protein ACRC67_12085 [Inquilinus sp.]|uniref:hypothetical protein n=1 Tax=Inquilinus sp. TaxID=1932117 RepID=UPI003F3F51FD
MGSDREWSKLLDLLQVILDEVPDPETDTPDVGILFDRSIYEQREALGAKAASVGIVLNPKAPRGDIDWTVSPGTIVTVLVSFGYVGAILYGDVRYGRFKDS